MKIYGLIGNPLGHSFSRKYFLEKFQHEGIKDSDYLNFELKDLRLEIAALKENPDLRGINVTIPFKTDIIKYLGRKSPEVAAINACNCIRIQNGIWEGFNTDIVGFERSFMTFKRPNQRKALILGTGGSSRAIAYVLKKAGIEFQFVSRNPNVSEGIISYSMLSPDLLREYTILINTTPVGMFPHVNDCPEIPFQFVGTEHYFFDLVYNPDPTRFLVLAASKGATVKNGSDMLAIQAEESWKIWNA
jgi:shikimate dehydrogenase